MNRDERHAVVLRALGAGPNTVSMIASLTSFSLTAAWKAVAELIFAGKVVFCGYRPSLSYKGGAPVKLYALPEHRVGAKPLIHNASKLKNAKRTEWKAPRPRRFAGSGVIAGRIIIGRGSKWGAGLA